MSLQEKKKKVATSNYKVDEVAFKKTRKLSLTLPECEGEK